VTAIPRLVGMIHLAPLPGSPRFGGDFDAVLTRAASDARALAEAGFPCLLVENFGDAPFLRSGVGPETVAAVTAAVLTVQDATGLPIGVNVLRNDGLSALGVAAITGASFVRVNVLVGTMYTDQGPIVGDAAAVMRKRAAICPGVEVWADVMVKHAVAPPGTELGEVVADTVERGLADAVIVSGSATGQPVDPDLGRSVRGRVPDGFRVVIGSGAGPENLGDLVEFADTVIVGSALKSGGDPTDVVDPGRATRFAEAAAAAGLI
jgi:uncharacterized protein